MFIDDLISVTWGPDAVAAVTPKSTEALDRDVRFLWRSVQALSGSSASEPSWSAVHTARALPALLQYQGELRLVYDAGLGTLFAQTFKILNDPQSDEVVDALLLRIAAVRRVCADRREVASALAAQADHFLRTHRVRDYIEDAESAFETWVAIAMAEQFAIAHELLHYLEAADAAAFERLREDVLGRLRSAVANLAPDSPLTLAHDLGLDRPDDFARSRAGVEPYSWWYAPRFEDPPALAHKPVGAVLAALVEQVERDRRLLTEVTCDVFAATACALFAQRGNGRSPLQSAASSTLALATLGLVVDMDLPFSATRPAGQRIGAFGEWELRLSGLRVLLADAVSASVPDPAAAPTPAEVADVMRRGTGLYGALLRSRLAGLDIWPKGTDADTGATRSDQLLSAGFLNLRPDPRGQSQREQEEDRATR